MILTDDQKLIVGVNSTHIFIVKKYYIFEFNRVYLTTIRKKIRNFEFEDILRILVYFEIRTNSGYKKGQSHINNHLSLSLKLNNSWKFEDICFRFYVAPLTSGYIRRHQHYQELSSSWERYIFVKLSCYLISER